MKKLIIILSTAVFLTACGNEENNTEMLTGVESILNEDSCYAYTFESVDELADFMITNKDGEYAKAFEHASQKTDSSKLNIYTLGYVPDNYKLYEIRTNNYSSFIAMDYFTKNPFTNTNEYSDENNFYEESELLLSSAAVSESSDGGIENNQSQVSQITFVWGFKTIGDDDFLQNDIKMLELAPMPGMDGYYYSEAVNEYGEDIYQIYWVEDGYSFQLNLPTHLLDEIGSYTTNAKSKSSNYSINIKKTAYSLKN